MNAMELLHTRRSIAKLAEPAPGPDELEQMFQAAFRAPDHAALRPWRFVVVQGKALERLGEIFVQLSLQQTPELSEEARAKLRSRPLRAPMLLVTAAEIKEHPKVPELEQQLAAGAAVQNLLLAAYALGYGAIWRTGSLAYLPGLPEALGLSANCQITGFIYLGTPQAEYKKIPEHSSSDYVSYLPVS